MTKFFKELFKGLKWVLISLSILAALIGMWLGCAWSLGWLVDNYLNIEMLNSQKYIGFGSVVLVFILIIQIITIILVLWALLAWGRSKGIVKIPEALQKKGK